MIESAAPLLEVRDLAVHFPFVRGPMFHRVHGAVRAVDGVSFTICAGETLGLVGESGCGKSTLARAILNLVPVTSGEVLWKGSRIDGLDGRRAGPFRRQVQMIFQDPFASLNPRMSVGRIIAEPMRIFKLHETRRRKLEVLRLLDMVGLNPRDANRYPHEFSGGQRQRIGIARALAVDPQLIVCDEPVSALDVSIQAQVINLLVDLQRRLGLAYLFIAHDLSVVRHISSRIGVMYLGRIVEMADARALYRQPQHPYTQALLSAAPIPDPIAQRQRRRIVLSGEVPTPDRSYPGCRFVDRCPIAEPRCANTPPELEGAGQKVACLVANERRNAKAATPTSG
ncbi:MAG TPA: oligopeptide/dipeptide ABC transporter ATP-binding protein [Pirellulales bacterium]|nr:oligopeptide/dipeptide ABC transporter ATP-binding protein [Pirellulales bacterium]